MKKNLFLLFLSGCQFVFSQLAINNTPQGEGVVEILKDSNSDVIKINNKVSDLFLLNKDGNLGISSDNPTNKLVIDTDDEFNTGLQFKTQYIPNNIMLSDADGNVYIEEKKFIAADFPVNQIGKLINEMENNNSNDSPMPVYTDLSINLSKGRWLVSVDLVVDLYRKRGGNQNPNEYIKHESVIVNDYSIICSFYLSDTREINITEDHQSRVAASNSLLLPSTPNQITNTIGLSTNSTSVKGQFLVNIESDYKRIYLIANCERDGLNGDTLVDVGVRPFINFNNVKNNQFFATPLY